MKIQKIETTIILLAFAFSAIACSGSSAQITQTRLEEQRVGRPIKNVLIIAIIDNQEIRAILEKHFKDWLNAKGVEGIISADVLTIDVGTEQKKEAITEVVDKYENDTILITRVVGMEESEVFSRDRPRYFFNYYGFYNYGLSYVTWPTIYGEKVQFSIETGLYDVTTESLIWSGISKLKNPKNTGQAIGQVVEMVMMELERNELLPKKP